MADLSDAQSALTTKVIGADPVTGVESNFHQITSAGGAHSNLRDSSGNEILSAITNPALTDRGLVTRSLPYELNKYAAATTNFTSATSATDVARIVGSATKTVRIKKIRISGRTTSGSPVACIIRLIKRSTANTGGTSVAATVVPFDSNSPAGTATVNHYTANPTLGTTVGDVACSSITFQASGLLQIIEHVFENPIILRGVVESLCINFNATTITGASICINFEWEEV